MQKVEPKNTDPRRCRGEMQTVGQIIMQLLGEVFCSAVFGWALIVGFHEHFNNKIKSLNDLWSDLPVLGLFGFLGVMNLFLPMIMGTPKALRMTIEVNQKGMTVQGVIIDKWKDTDEEGSVTPYVGYRFSYQDMEWVGKKFAGSSPFNKLQIGDNVAIRFLPRNPNISRLELGNSH